MKRPPFDPQIDAALRDPAKAVVTGMEPGDIDGLRGRDPQPSAEELTLQGRFTVSTHRFEGKEGAALTMWVWWPTGGRRPFPLLYHIHGGGLVLGTALAGILPVLDLAVETGCAVASIEYRLAPEHPYPAAVNDCYAGLEWLADRADGLGIRSDRIIIEGVSAGGGLAAATALLARESQGPALAAQMLVCPMLDDRNDSFSTRQMAGVGAWDRQANLTGWTAYLGEQRGGDGVLETAAPARATDLSGLPPTFLDVGSSETFRDEVIHYAALMWQCGGTADLHVWAGGCHGFDELAPEAIVSGEARRTKAAWLGRILHHLDSALED